MLQLIMDYSNVLLYIGILGGIGCTLSNLFSKRGFQYTCLKVVVFYLFSFLFGALLSAGVYFLCEVVLALPFYVQIPLSVFCSFIVFDIIFTLNKNIKGTKC